MKSDEFCQNEGGGYPKHPCSFGSTHPRGFRM
jgi:hypothetical protein